MHKMRNIIDKIKNRNVGEDYVRLLKRLPFNTDFNSVNKIIWNFMRSDTKEGKGYIAKIFNNIEN